MDAELVWQTQTTRYAMIVWIELFIKGLHDLCSIISTFTAAEAGRADLEPA
jgi:hypothetical protein